LSGGEVVLYRCKTPTNVLCPCGAVARRLKKLDIEYRTERVGFNRGDRPEIVELTGQARVPVLIDGEEIVHDSKRILQYLDHAHSPGGDEEDGGEGDADGDDEDAGKEEA
jgi:hypothetical protein